MVTTSIPTSIASFCAATVAAALMSVAAQAQPRPETAEKGDAMGSCGTWRADEGVSLMAASVIAAAKTGSGMASLSEARSFNGVADSGAAYRDLILQGLVLEGVGEFRPQRLDLAVASAPILSCSSRPDTGCDSGIVAVQLNDGRRVNVD